MNRNDEDYEPDSDDEMEDDFTIGNEEVEFFNVKSKEVDNDVNMVDIDDEIEEEGENGDDYNDEDDYEPLPVRQYEDLRKLLFQNDQQTDEPQPQRTNLVQPINEKRKRKRNDENLDREQRLKKRRIEKEKYNHQMEKYPNFQQQNQIIEIQEACKNMKIFRKNQQQQQNLELIQAEEQQNLELLQAEEQMKIYQQLQLQQQQQQQNSQFQQANEQIEIFSRLEEQKQQNIDNQIPERIIILETFKIKIKIYKNPKYYDVGDLERHEECGCRRFKKQSEGTCCLLKRSLIPKYAHPIEDPIVAIAGVEKEFKCDFEINETIDPSITDPEKIKKLQENIRFKKLQKRLITELFEIYNTKEFNKHCRALNYLFSISTLSCKPSKGDKGKGLHFRGFPSNVVIHGSTFSIIFPLNKKQTQRGNGNYFHSIIHDKNSEQLNEKLEKPIVRELYHKINKILVQINPMFMQYKRLVDADNEFNNNNKEMYIKWDVTDYVHRRNRTYAVPFEKKQIGIILNDDPQYEELKRRLVVFPIEDNPDGFGQKIDIFSRCADAIQFPLLFPLANASWGSEGKIRYYPVDPVSGQEKTQKEVTIREYYNTRILMEDILTFGGSLLNEFICNSYSKIREKRMREYKNPNWQQRVYKKYELFEDVVSKKGGSFQAGRTYVPGNYSGGIRDKKKRYNNLLELQYKFGPCPIFLTFTTNTSWPEIKRNIHPWQYAADRPDVAIAVYHLKQQELLRDIRQGKIFGNKSMYFSNSVEFQKKGHTHCHLLIRLKGAQPESGDEIDKIIMARAPVKIKSDGTPKMDKITKKTILDTESELFKLVIGEKDERTGRWNGLQIHHHSVKFCGVEPDDTTTICKKGFPKPLCLETYVDKDSGVCYYKRIHEVDRMVVSFSPPISFKYRVHHCSDIANSRDPRYCFKYCFKDESERARILISNPDDEVDETKFEMEGLYVSASEAMYRIKGFELNQIEPAMQVLFIHLDHNAPVYKRVKIQKRLKDLETNLTQEEYLIQKQKLELEISLAKDKLEQNPTDVVRYFYRPNPDKETNPEEWEFFDKLKYIEYKETFISQKTIHKVQQKLKNKFLSFKQRSDLSLEQKVEKVDGLWVDEVKKPAKKNFLFKRLEYNVKYYRLQNLVPNKGEVFFFTLLLLHKSGRSYDDFLTVKTKNKDTGEEEKKLYSSFQESCIAEGLFSDKNEFFYTLNEIIKRKHVPYDLRNTFCYLIQEETCPGRTLFKQFATYLVEDWEFKPKSDNNNPNFKKDDNSTIRRESIVKLLKFIKKKLKGSIRMIDLGLPDIIDNVDPIEKELNKFAKEKDKIYKEFEEKIKLANREQRCLILLIVTKVLLKLPYKLFVNAKAGRGKTFWVKTVALFFRFIDLLVELWATTGKGAIQYPNGKTMHKGGGVPFKKERDPVVNCSVTNARAAVLGKSRLLSIDEVTIGHIKNLIAVIKLLEKLKNMNIVYIFSGDKHQTCTIVEKALRKQQILDATFMFSDLIKKFTITELTIPVRDAEDPVYSRMCDLIGAQKLPNVDPLYANNPDEKIIELPIKYSTDKKTIYDWVHPNVLDIKECKKAVVQCDYNTQVDIGNNYFLNKLPGEVIRLEGVEKCKKDEFNEKYSNLPFNINQTYLKNWKEPGIPHHFIDVKPRCLLMQMRNMDESIGLMNGAIMECIHPGRRVLTCRILDTNKLVELPRIRFDLKIKNVGSKIYRLQFPVRLAYCMSKHKVQGDTYERTGIDNSSQVFSHGAGYTSFTRVGGYKKIKCYTKKSKVNPNNDKVRFKNVVYKELIDLEQDTVKFEKKDLIPEFVEAILNQFVAVRKENELDKIIDLLNLFIVDEREEEEVKNEEKITVQKLIDFVGLKKKYSINVSENKIFVNDSMDIIEISTEEDDKMDIDSDDIKEKSEKAIDEFIKYLNEKEDSDENMANEEDTDDQEEVKFTQDYVVLHALRKCYKIIDNASNLDEVLEKVNEDLQENKYDVLTDKEEFRNYVDKNKEFNDYYVSLDLNSISYFGE